MSARSALSRANIESMASGNTTFPSEPPARDRPRSPPERKPEHAFVVIHSVNQPERAGEIAHFVGTLVRIGRDQATALHAVMVDDAPGAWKETGPLVGAPAPDRTLRAGLPRDAIDVIIDDDDDIRVENLKPWDGKSGIVMRVNGVEAVTARIKVGSTVEIVGFYSFVLVKRRFRIPALEGWPAALKFPGARDVGGSIGASEVWWEHRRSLLKASRAKRAVLLSGESGSGKESSARLIHALGPRADYKPIIYNCANLNTGASTSELAGMDAGYPNGGTPLRLGLLERAHLSTLFLDEIHRLPDNEQTSLFRAMDYGEVQRLGTSGAIRNVDVRCIFATNRPIDDPVLLHDFRGRIEIFIHVPPLRDRPEDVPLLLRDRVLLLADEEEGIERFILKREGRRPEVRFDAGLVGYLVRYPYGNTNVRELYQLLRKAIDATPDGSDTIMNPFGDAMPAAQSKPVAAPAREPEYTDEHVYMVWVQQAKNAVRTGEAIGISRFRVKSAVDRYLAKHPELVET